MQQIRGMAMAAKQIAAAKSCKSSVHALLTGPPGVGKTTLIRKVCSELQKHSIALRGFYTEEVRERGREEGRGRGPRVGFDVVTLDGKRGPLARVESSHQAPAYGGRKPVYVGKYRVDMESFERIALPTLQTDSSITEQSTELQSESERTNTVFVIDEIGKMELFSGKFVEAVKAVFQCPGVVVLATLPVARQKCHWLVEELRHRPDCMLFEVSERNRDHLSQEITEFLLKNLPIQLHNPIFEANNS